MNGWISTTTLLLGQTQRFFPSDLLGGGPFWGKVAFIGTFVLLLIWLIVMPGRLIQQEPGTPIWKSARAWAILITLVQIGVYSILG